MYYIQDWPFVGYMICVAGIECHWDLSHHSHYFLVLFFFLFQAFSRSDGPYISLHFVLFLELLFVSDCFLGQPIFLQTLIQPSLFVFGWVTRGVICEDVHPFELFYMQV